MNKERLEYLVNEMYYNYLEQNEAKELIDYIEDLQQRIDKAIEKLYCWGEALNPEFQKQMLDILKGVE